MIGRDGPAKNTWVNLKLAGDDYGIDRQATTDEKGSFEVRGVPPGSYVILAYQRDEGNGVYEAGGQQKVEVSDENLNVLRKEASMLSLREVLCRTPLRSVLPPCPI